MSDDADSRHPLASPHLGMGRAVVVVAAALVGVAVSAGCGSTRAQRNTRGAGGRGATVSVAPDCSTLVREAPFAPAAEFVETTSGTARGCTLSLPASSSALERLAIKATCDPEASILVPLNQDEDGWYVDFEELRKLDNGQCVSA